MPPALPLIPEMLRRLVLRLILMLGCVRHARARVAWLRLRLDGLRDGHRHRARLAREVARAERYAALLEDREAWRDPGMAGKAAEVARVMADAGRRAVVRRVLWPARARRWRGFALVAAARALPARCTGRVGGWRASAPLTLAACRDGGRAMFGLAERRREGFRRRCVVAGRAWRGSCGGLQLHAGVHML